MSSSTSLDRVALLTGGDNDFEEGKGRWWRRVLDWEEASNQVFLSLPMIVCNVSYFSITLISVMFAGHLGELELAGATLANSWASVTGFAFMLGLSGALETLCASCIISCFFPIIISILWIYTEPIFILLHQDPQISKIAALYMKDLILGLFAYAFVQNILRFLQTQSIVTSLVWFSVLSLGIHFGIVYTLINQTSLGFKGASLAASISLWISFLLLATYVGFAKKLKQTWEGLSSESFGVARGCGWEHLAVWANLGTFYFIGMPIACLLGFMLKLYDKGLWIGLICGLSCQASALLSITLFSKWAKIDVSIESGKETLGSRSESGYGQTMLTDGSWFAGLAMGDSPRTASPSIPQSVLMALTAISLLFAALMGNEVWPLFEKRADSWSRFCEVKASPSESRGNFLIRSSIFWFCLLLNFALPVCFFVSFG
ncbi:Multi antimicrobial extrusion protein - like 10 [Theobroma cacao]|nr:Multi antimicrobial extrusion protein - like 10 [Theobroma cacao]